MEALLLVLAILAGIGVGSGTAWYLLQRRFSEAFERAAKAEGDASNSSRQVEMAGQALEQARRTISEQTTSLARAEAERDGVARERDSHVADVISLKNQLEGAAKEIRTLQEERAQLREKNGALELLNTRREEESAGQKQWVEEQTAHLRVVFAETASKLLDDKAAKFGSSNKEQIEALMKPFQAQLSEFRKRVDEVHNADTSAQAKLESQIASLAQRAADVGTTANNLAKAMLGNSKKQGDWGEHQLIALLEQAGFVKGKHFETQVGARDDDAGRRYADVVLRLPENRCLVLDSKLTLPSWVTYCSTDDPKTREAALAAMVSNMRDHVEELAAIDYAQILGKEGSVPFTLMFVPIEAAGIEAFRVHPELFANAQRRKIIMVTPTTLFSVLQLVLGLWSIHDRHQNSLKIADQGRLLLRKLGTFIGSFKTVGDRLSAALTSYETARGQLQTGPGNLVSIADRMKNLGVEVPKDGELAKLIAESRPITEARTLVQVEDEGDSQDRPAAQV
jgi:DNA recombination protein RmuC